ncbi:MAG TPA: DNA polymerase I [Candidatus Marinimicrobia bacterium]|nr:DNA polymerase I [Candidatus Neomarinimicrobiota bacterium]
MSKKKTLYLIDGSAIAYRSYFGMIRNRLTNSAGQPTGAVFTYINSLLKLIEEEQPDYIGMVFDAPEKTFRHKIYEDYKATREAMPDELVSQLPYIHKVTEALNIPVIIRSGYEADDIIGTLAKQARQQGFQVYMVTGDKDFMQLLEPDIFVYKPASGQKAVEVIDVDGVVAKWGVRPEQIADYLGLIGDTSDNIPGVKGIGPAKARPLLQEFGNLENLIENADKIGNPRVRDLIKNSAEEAQFSKLLATIKTDVPVNIDIEKLRSQAINRNELIKLFEELEFYSLIKTFSAPSKSEKAEKDYRTLKERAEIKKLTTTIKNVKLLSVDLETTSTSPMSAEIVGVSLAWEPNRAVYIPIKFPAAQKSLFGASDNSEFLELLKPVMESESVSKCGQNLKYDMLILKRCGIELKAVEFDTMIAAFLIQPDSRSYKLDRLAQQYLNYTMQPIEELIGKGKNQITMDEVAVEKVSFYAAEDADVALQLVPILREKLKEDQTEEIFKSIEMPLIPVLMQMEENGVYLDTDFMKQMSKDLSKQIEKLTDQIYFEAGLKFNINSPKQLAEVLFDHLELSSGRKRSTAVNVLEKLRDEHPLPGLILDYRTLAKLQNTYVDAIPQLVNPQTGRVHSSFNQTVASTGRLSSSDPNFQNIPIRTDIGREIRKAFVPQKKGWKILSADYSQIELRIMAHLSKDPELIKAFKEDVDVHTRTAALVYGVPEKDVLPEMRRVAKVVNFGIMYGAGPFRMSEELKIPMEEARKIVDHYFNTYPGINNYIINTLNEARENGFVKTLSGRLRYVHDINSSNKNIRDAAERAAINMPIQGTAADMIKIAMIGIHNRMEKKKLQSMMILQIHDELLFEVANDELEVLKSIVKEEMEGALPLDIPVKVDVGIGNSWYEAH